MRAEVGDTIEVVFRNGVDFDTNIMPTGVDVRRYSFVVFTSTDVT